MLWHLVTPEFPPRVGGVSDYARLIARELAEAGDEVHVWCPPGGKSETVDRFLVHAELGGLRRTDLDRLDRLLDRFALPRRLLVQWVPHGYGHRAMNLAFCLWLWQRSRRGDEIDLMVHEPYLAFWEGTWRQAAAAIVHRVMTIVLLRAAKRVWVAIPSWERAWRPYTFGRKVPFGWLPIPSSLNLPAAESVCALKRELTGDTRALVGHFGTYGSSVGNLLLAVLPAMLAQPTKLRVLLIGSGSDDFRRRLVEICPQFADTIIATGSLTPTELAAHVAACDVLVQPYPDGISSRRTTAMAALRLGIPVVTTSGRLTEHFWEESRAVLLSDAGDSRRLAAHVDELLQHLETRRLLGNTGKELYERLFDVRHTIAALRATA